MFLTFYGVADMVSIATPAFSSNWTRVVLLELVSRQNESSSLIFQSLVIRKQRGNLFGLLTDVQSLIATVFHVLEVLQCLNGENVFTALLGHLQTIFITKSARLDKNYLFMSTFDKKIQED